MLLLKSTEKEMVLKFIGQMIKMNLADADAIGEYKERALNASEAQLKELTVLTTLSNGSLVGQIIATHDDAMNQGLSGNIIESALGLLKTHILDMKETEFFNGLCICARELQYFRNISKRNFYFDCTDLFLIVAYIKAVLKNKLVVGQFRNFNR